MHDRGNQTSKRARQTKVAPHQDRSIARTLGPVRGFSSTAFSALRCAFSGNCCWQVRVKSLQKQGSSQFYSHDNMLYGADSGQGSSELGNRLREAMALADSASPSPAPLATEGPF